MGTSNSTGGPRDSTPLLPAWALPGGGPDADAPDGEDGADVDSPDAHDDSGSGSDSAPNTDDNGVDSDNDPAGADPTDDVPGVETGTPATPPAYWRSAKRQLGAAVSGRTGRAGLAKAGRAYVRALGGSRNAARSSASARSSTSRLGSFLSDVAGRGIGPAMDAIGLGSYVGRDAQTVFAAIVDAIAPDASDIEQAAAREAVNETLAGLFEQFVSPDGNVAALESMTADTIRSAVETSVAASIFHRWLGDLEKQLEDKAVTPSEAVRLERDMAIYIRETVKLDLSDRDPLKMEWAKPDGVAFMERIYQEAYSILGSGAMIWHVVTRVGSDDHYDPRSRRPNRASRSAFSAPTIGGR